MDYYTDSDHVGDRKLGTRSHSAFMAKLNGIPVHWRSRKQPKTVLSPAHAEIYACSEGVKEARQLQWILADMGVELPWPIRIKVDNTQVISFCNQTCLDSKLKGMIDNRESWVGELKDEGTVVVEYVNTRLNQADILSKCLAGTQFREQVVMISGGCLKSQVKREDIFVNLCQVVKKSRAGAAGAPSVKLQSQESGGVSSEDSLSLLVEESKSNRKSCNCNCLIKS